jgi:hypothetical protein
MVLNNRVRSLLFDSVMEPFEMKEGKRLMNPIYPIGIL